MKTPFIILAEPGIFRKYYQEMGKTLTHITEVLREKIC
jgi:hypothetical protein